MNLHELLTVASEAIVADISFFVAPTYDRKLGIGQTGHWALGMGRIFPIFYFLFRIYFVGK
ncbi:hypothetical protein A6S26_26640 [Nostoc sp. ATCC 43529]|nr:hypothetical protein A6S26_26640 [Nostoc sp. ATCC 43529]